MKELNFKIKGTKQLKPTIKVDGKQLKFKKNEFGSHESKFVTDKDKIEVCIYRYLEINSPLWFIMSIFFYIISIFGLLDPIREKQPIVLDYKVELDLTKIDKANIDFTLNQLQNEGKAIEIKTDVPVNEISNVYYLDKKAEKRLKIMKAVKILLFIAAVVGLIFLVKGLF